MTAPQTMLDDLSRSIDRIENAYAFECEAGPLKNCSEWKHLKRLMAALTLHSKSFEQIEAEEREHWDPAKQFIQS